MNAAANIRSKTSSAVGGNSSANERGFSMQRHRERADHCRIVSRRGEAVTHNANTPRRGAIGRTLRHGIEHSAQRRLPSLAAAQQHEHRERA
jgi:hypothetical protein